MLNLLFSIIPAYVRISETDPYLKIDTWELVMDMRHPIIGWTIMLFPWLSSLDVEAIQENVPIAYIDISHKMAGRETDTVVVLV